MFRPLMRVVYIYYLLCFLIIINPSPLLTCSAFPVLSKIRCHEDESSALLAFRNSMSIHNPYNVDIRSRKNGSDCCEWQGVLCDDTTHHVVELDLLEAGLVGKLDSNSSLFLLRHLRSLYLSFNDFSNSPISPKFGMFPLLKRLNLRYSNFSGEVPLEIAQLSKLEYLGLASSSDKEKLKMSNFNTIIANMTELRDLYLNIPNIDSTFPPSLDSNSSLSHLYHLESLSLTFNNFNGEIPPEMAQLSKLESLSLTFNNCTGEIPPEMAKLSKLECLDLFSDNDRVKMSNFKTIIANMTQLERLNLDSINIDSTFPPSFTNLSSLTNIDIISCNLRGELSANIFNMPDLRFLRVRYNDGLHAHFPQSNWSSPLEQIDVFNVNFSSNLPSSLPLSSYNLMTYLYLSNCDLYGSIPSWIWNLTINTGDKEGLQGLDLSSNNLSGNINLNDTFSQLQLHTDSTSALQFLNLSFNYLTGSLTSLPWSNLKLIDLSYNMLEGPIPNVLSLDSYTGNDTSPTCFTSNCYKVDYLDLSNNKLEGLVPQSLSHLKTLRYLNLKNNRLRDKFPNWLDTLPYLMVLDLSSNAFYGPLAHSNENNSFPMLHILDLSNNNFSENIPTHFIKKLKSMMKLNVHSGSPDYMGTYYIAEDFSIVLTFNGVRIPYQKIITSMFFIDLSNNKFEGEIPENIGQLVAIHGLNLSHNQLTGPIPPSLGRLTLLNSLDLSSNMLTGQIPQELTSLNSMGVFNVTENKLVGCIPDQLIRFPLDSYKGNPGLCGLPLKECAGDGRSRKTPSSREPREDDMEDVSILSLLEWKVIMMGCGSGLVVGFTWGYYMLWVSKPFWLVKLVHLMVSATNGLLKGQFGRCKRGSISMRS